MTSKIEQRLKQIFSDTFGIQFYESTIIDSISFKNIDKWDSFGHVELITKIESDFKIHLNFEEIIDMKDYKTCLKTIIDKLS